MKITLNGLENPENIITFTNCPTILTVSDTWTGTRALTTINLKTGSVLSSTTAGTYDSENIPITINGYGISSTQDISKAIGTKYYMPKTITSSNIKIVANSIANALRNVGALSAKYKIYQVMNGTSVSSSVRIEAIQQGIMTTTISVDPALRNVITTTTTNGSISSIFNGSTRNKICIDIYNVDIPIKIGGGTTTNISYLTTLEKNVYNSDISFDLSPIFNSYVNEGSISQFQVVIYSIVDSSMNVLGRFNSIYAVPGYAVNQGNSFISRFTGCVLAQNVRRGTTRAKLNNSLLYVYYPSLTFSLYADTSTTTLNCTVAYIDNAENLIQRVSQVIFCSSSLNTFEVALSEELLKQASYVDMEVPNLGTLRYNVIKPLHATDEQQRIYWNNSYGGTSFFDFTGTRTEERKTDIETYDKSLFDYYKSNRAELKKIYSKDVEITVTLTTHNITRDGTWQLFDLQNSFNAWTTVNGKEYGIHITDIKVDETDVAGIYTAEIEYTYSLGDTL